MFFAPGGEESGGGHVQQGDRDDGQNGAAQAAERPVPDGQGHKKTAPRTVRPNTTADGGMCSTATRMKTNELPQITDVAAKSNGAFRLTALLAPAMPRCPAG